MFLEKFRLDGQVALVTGGSRGLGLEAALALKEAGAKVAVLARRAAFFEEARKVLGEALYLEGDVRDEARLEAVVEEVERELGPLSILVNAAGISWGAPSLEMPTEKVREVLEVNLVGAFLASRAAARRMRTAWLRFRGGTSNPSLWHWSANWAYVDSTRDLLYRDGSPKVFLSDYWDLTFGAYRMVR